MTYATDSGGGARMSPRSAVALVGLWCLLLAGCEHTEADTVAVHPVSGTVLVDNKPAAGVEVTLLAVDPNGFTVAPHGRTGEDGTFQLTSYELNDGAPAGDYQVMIEWKVPEDPEISVDDVEAMTQVLDRLQGRYAAPESSGIAVTVSPGINELPPFELK